METGIDMAVVRKGKFINHVIDTLEVEFSGHRKVCEVLCRQPYLVPWPKDVCVPLPLIYKFLIAPYCLLNTLVGLFQHLLALSEPLIDGWSLHRSSAPGEE